MNQLLDIEAETAALNSRKEQLMKLIRLRDEVEDMEKLVFSGLLSKHKLKIVMEEVSGEFKLSIESLLMPSRRNEVVYPRMVVFYLARNCCDLSLESIAGMFQKDHTTVMHGEKTVKNRMETEKEFKVLVEKIESKCRDRFVKIPV